MSYRPPVCASSAPQKKGCYQLSPLSHFSRIFPEERGAIEVVFALLFGDHQTWSKRKSLGASLLAFLISPVPFYKLVKNSHGQIPFLPLFPSHCLTWRTCPGQSQALLDFNHRITELQLEGALVGRLGGSVSLVSDP